MSVSVGPFSIVRWSIRYCRSPDEDECSPVYGVVIESNLNVERERDLLHEYG